MSRFLRPLNRHQRRKVRRSAGARSRRGLLWVVVGLILVLIVAVARARLQAAF